MRFFPTIAVLVAVISITIISFQTSETKEDVVKINDDKKIYKEHEITAHKSLYDIKMVSKQSSSNIINVSGKMYFEWYESCDAWITNNKLNLIYEYIDSPSMNIVIDFNSYETFDGNLFEFSSKTIRDGEVIKNIRGAAKKNEDNTGVAIFTSPEDLKYKLERGYYLPMKHTIELLKRIKRGDKIFMANVFDGVDEDGPVDINSFIVGEINALALLNPTANIDTALVNNKAWNIRMSFFNGDKPEEEASDYEMNVILHENSVISDAIIEYSDFTIEQKLIALEKLESTKCNN